MKAKISKLSKGIFENSVPELELSVGSIEGAICTDGILSGSFLIRSLSGQEARGLLYTDAGRIVLKETSFIGKQAEIHYEIHGNGMAAGEEFKGCIYIVSDGGELKLPCRIQVEAPFAMTSMGKIRNLFHFANLVRNHYEEAKRLFLSSDFADIFLVTNPHACAVYEILKDSVCTDTAMEEFLVSVHKKSRVMLTIGEDRQEYPEFEHTVGNTITLSKSGWGYLSIEIKVDGDFIKLERNTLTSGDFSGSIYPLFYTIEEDKVHAGKNFGRIFIVTPYQELCVEIYVEKYRDSVKRVKTLERQRFRKELKKGLCKLAEEYFSFRLHKMNTEAWCKRSLKLIERLINQPDAPLFLELLQIHLILTQKKNKEAGFLVQHIEDRVLRVKDRQPELYAYYLYVKVLYLRDDRELKETLLTVRRLYEGGKDSWQILWILMYLDEEYAQNQSLKLVRLKEQYAKGARSPFLYYEACAVINEQPELIRILNGFELQAVWWGVQHGAISEKAGLVIAEQSQLEKNGSLVLYRILELLYERYKNKLILESLLSLFIRDKRVEKRYFRWYEEGISSQCGIAGLYEIYLDTFPDHSREQIPKLAAMYFSFDNSLNDKTKEKLYENLLRNDPENGSILKNHRAAIEQFALTQAAKGNINRKLAYIYKKVIKTSLLNQEMAKHYPEILLSAWVQAEGKKGRIIVRYKECTKELSVPIENGGACVPLYTEEAAVLYEDERRRRFLILPVHQEITSVRNCRSMEPVPLFHEEAMIRSCYELDSGDVLLWLHICEKEGMYRAEGVDIELYTQTLASPFVRQYYKNQLSQRIIEYYMENYDGDKLEEQLKQLDMDGLLVRERLHLVELMIARAMYEEAYRALRRYGYEGIAVNRLMKLCIYLLWAKEREKEEFLLEMCASVFFRGKYDEMILNYLLKYYNSTTKHMLFLWHAAIDFSIDATELEERLLAQMLFSGSSMSYLMEVFEVYYKKGVNQMLIGACLAQQAHGYFVNNQVVSDRLFYFIEQEYIQHRKEVPDICRLALLRFYSEQEMLSAVQIKLAKVLMDEFLEENKCFGFYKKFERYMELVPYLRDKTIIEYQSRTEDAVEIHYMLDTGISGKKVYEIRRMERSYAAFYVMEFTLFYGERLRYYIAECGQDGERLTKKDTLLMDSFDTASSESRYRLLNDICACVELRDTVTLKELMQSYAEKKTLAEKGFAIL